MGSGSCVERRFACCCREMNRSTWGHICDLYEQCNQRNVSLTQIAFYMLPTSIRLRRIWWRAGLDCISALRFNMFWEFLRRLLFGKENNISFSIRSFARGREMLHYRNGTKVAKSHISFVIPVCLSVRMQQTRPPLDRFS